MKKLGSRTGSLGLMALALSSTALGLPGCAVSRPAAKTAADGGTATGTAQRPNVLFILVDDLRPDLGIYGHPTAQTPNMDALGRSGIVFDNAFVSQAVCGPSRAALMTGLRPDSTGITNLETPVDKAVPGAVTILDTFRHAGYKTLGYGKVYHHVDDDADGWSVREEDMEHVLRKGANKAKQPKVAAARVPDSEPLPNKLNVDMALKALPGLAKSKEPFFMAVGIHRPHLPFISPESAWARYTPARVPPPINPEGQKDAPPWAMVSYEVWNYPDTKSFEPNMPKAKADELRWAYLAAVSYADDMVGQLTAALKKQGLDKNTIIVLWGDHGWKLGDHNAWAKHSTADIDIRVPLIVSAPGTVRAGSRSNAIVETVDIYPTLADLAGLKAPSNLEGLSMTPLFADPARKWKSAAFAQYPRNGSAGMGRLMGYTVRNVRYRYTAWVSQKDGSVVAKELYDLQKDPIESVNVAGDKAYAQAVKDLEATRKSGWQAVRKGVTG